MESATDVLRKVSHYELESLLGRGGMGAVWKARDLKLGRTVALKFFRADAPPETRQRFLEEARLASRLDHPNLCTIFEIDETADGETFVAMAWYEGHTLDRILVNGALETGRATNLAIQAGRGLAAAHEQLLVHRDLKPGNLMITRGDSLKILDFGIARLFGSPLEPGRITGTPAYMSPEQLRGEPVDPRSDIWSLGVVFYEMLTGVNPFRRDRIEDVVATILNLTPAPPSRLRPEIPPRADRIVERSLARDLRTRYERIEAMVHDLEDLAVDADSDAITLQRRTVAARSSIAVLPFEDMSPARDQDYLCSGLAEEILRALGHIPDLHVASRTSSFRFRRSGADAREIGASLGVESILEGSVRRCGDRLRISAQLVNVETGYRLWNERYDRDIQDIFAIEDDVAQRVAAALQVTLTRSPRGRTGPPTPAEAEAWQLYLQGRQYFHQQREKAFKIAIQSFREAIALDPACARAWAGIADCHSFLHMHFGGGPAAVEEADEASLRAIELAPDLPESRAARGMALYVKRDYRGAEDELQRAIALAPHLYDPHYLYGRVAFSEGRIEEAARHYREACAISREAFDCWYLLGMCYRRLGDPDRARAAERECMEGARLRVREHPDDTRAWTMGAAVLASLGDPHRASDWLARALAVDPEEPIILYNAACVYTALGQHDDAIRCLEASVGRAGLAREWVANDPDLDALRGDPRFEALVATKETDPRTHADSAS